MVSIKRNVIQHYSDDTGMRQQDSDCESVWVLTAALSLSEERQAISLQYYSNDGLFDGKDNCWTRKL